jgi:putative PIN family toxin of toxin-antitoxin system
VKVVLDTNVFISGVFFTGPPYEILKAWRDGKLRIVVSPEILDEYRRVGQALANRFVSVDLGPILHLLTVTEEPVSAPSLPEQVCEDPDDDKFLACALAGKTKIVISGDRQLLKATGYRGIEVISPRGFIDQ